MMFSKKNQEEKEIAMMFATFFGIVCVSVFSVCLFAFNVKPEKTQVSGPIAKKIVPDPFSQITINAKSAYVLDTVTGKVLFSKNEEVQLPLASVTKVMTALVASAVPEDTIVTIKSSDLSEGRGGLTISEKWSLKELLGFTLVVSSNSGSKALAGAAGAFLGEGPRTSESEDENSFILAMNKKAQMLDLKQTFYLNPSGLDVSVEGGLSGAYGSARDMANLFSYIIKNKPDLLGMTAYDSLLFKTLDGSLHSAENTNEIAGSLPGLIASKTGYTDLADGNLVIAFDAGPSHPIVVAVLGSTEEGRFSDVKKLSKAAIEKMVQGE